LKVRKPNLNDFDYFVDGKEKPLNHYVVSNVNEKAKINEFQYDASPNSHESYIRENFAFSIDELKKKYPAYANPRNSLKILGIH
jgi:hypothetical protein